MLAVLLASDDPRTSWSFMHPIGQLTHTRRSDGAPEPDGALKAVARAKIPHYRQLYLNRPDQIAFMPVAVDTSDRIYDDCSRLLFFHAHRATVKHRLWLTNYRGIGSSLTDSNFVFFALLA
jgi:hypothetical protein